jgi:hypothetical protein
MAGIDVKWSSGSIANGSWTDCSTFIHSLSEPNIRGDLYATRRAHRHTQQHRQTQESARRQKKTTEACVNGCKHSPANGDTCMRTLTGNQHSTHTTQGRRICTETKQWGTSVSLALKNEVVRAGVLNSMASRDTSIVPERLPKSPRGQP